MNQVGKLPSHRRRGAWWGAILTALVIAAFSLAGVAASASQVAHAARNCSLPHYPGLGYFTSLSVSGTNCSTGTKVAFAYYRCRTRHGKAGRCSGGVLGFSCSEHRNSIPTEIDARVTCRRRHETVIHTYQQDT
jgi:hypothetical protein